MNEMNQEKILQKAYETGRITQAELVYVLMNMFIWENEYILDTGDSEMVNAEIVLRLKGKEKKLHKIFWEPRR